ncbi:hypothetical protein QUB05_20555 [Microcoleus sp. F10-C6]|uniref:hypothetical protein n=1 Tax=unclassified Microcoleus TaxID=2642155 RepID=UPI002FCFA422
MSFNRILAKADFGRKYRSPLSNSNRTQPALDQGQSTKKNPGAIALAAILEIFLEFT